MVDNFSFLKLFNSIKGVTKPAQEGYFDENWLKDKKFKRLASKFDRFFAWCKANGIKHPKVKYPVLFGSGEHQYLGCMAIKDIGRNEALIKVPSHLIISAYTALHCEALAPVFYNNPQTFGRHVPRGEDNVLDTYLLYQLKLGEKSEHYEMFQTWPQYPDILMNWDDDELASLQDAALLEEAECAQDEFFDQWSQLYTVLKRYSPDLFSEKDITMSKLKYVYMITTSRAFSSNWLGMSILVSFADFMNHENVDTSFDCVDDRDSEVEEIKPSQATLHLPLQHMSQEH